MVCVCWFFLVLMACVCVPGFGSLCLDSSICNNLSNKGNIMDCIHLCMSVIQTEFPELDASGLKSNDDEDLLLSIVLSKMVSEDKISESELKAHRDQRRSYSMEHFRWGKPTGRKRRPVKVFASSLEGGGSFENNFPFQARRQLSINEEEAMGGPNGESHQNKVLLNARVVQKPQTQLSAQHRKDGTYRMSHFRWGSPPVSKRNSLLMKTLEKKPQAQLVKLLRNILDKDVQRIME
ncbi:pro-opiomelanocortin-like [Notolabrus celidotus]|uniref:pro-opiomelanocortin-like n=1 Tax=Notolabrus celidotus TaxID=1203425 RepID=UPI00148FD5B6|nr:pro-opiomelanocortin-like [Notolabrus celidotus]